MPDKLDYIFGEKATPQAIKGSDVQSEFAKPKAETEFERQGKAYQDLLDRTPWARGVRGLRRL